MCSTCISAGNEAWDMTIEYIKSRADLNPEVDFRVNDAIGTIMIKYNLNIEVGIHFQGSPTIPVVIGVQNCRVSIFYFAFSEIHEFRAKNKKRQ